MTVIYCDGCNVPIQRCECAEREKARLEALRPPTEAEKQVRLEAEAREQARRIEEREAIERVYLGGLRAVSEFTLEKFRGKKAIEMCTDFPKQSLYIFGPTGSGKTHLATGLIRRLGGIVRKPTGILRELRSCSDADAEIQFLEHISHCYLVIDELGIEKLTEWAITSLYEIIDRRWMDCPGALIVTANVSLNDLSKKIGDDRITSRLNGMCKIIKLTGDDGRMK